MIADQRQNDLHAKNDRQSIRQWKASSPIEYEDLDFELEDWEMAPKGTGLSGCWVGSVGPAATVVDRAGFDCEKLVTDRKKQWNTERMKIS